MAKPPVLPVLPTRLSRWCGVLVCALLLGGCAVMSEQQCRSADWREQGLRDALAGHPRARLADIQDACAEAGVRPDVARYWDGWTQGIYQFCSPDNGARWGREGRSYQQSCPPQLEAGFLDNYRLGRRLWDAEKALQQLQAEQNDRQRALDKAQDDKQRRSLRADLQDLDRRLRNAREDLERAQRHWRERY